MHLRDKLLSILICSAVVYFLSVQGAVPYKYELSFDYTERELEGANSTNSSYSSSSTEEMESSTSSLNGTSESSTDEPTTSLGPIEGHLGTCKVEADDLMARVEDLRKSIIEELGNDLASLSEEKRTQEVEDAVATVHLQLMYNNITGYVQEAVEAAWDYNTDINDDTAEVMNDAYKTLGIEYKCWWENLLSVYDYNATSPQVSRQFQMQQSIGTAILDPEDIDEFNNLVNSMTELYNKKICKFDEMDCYEDKYKYDLEELERQMATNREYSELLYYWEKWRDETGKEMIDDFQDYVNLLNDAAEMNDFEDATYMWLAPYTTYESGEYTAEDFMNDVEGLWEDIKPFYEKIHAYVRYRLEGDDDLDYGRYISDDDNLIPANVLGNMWAQSWENIYDLVTPFDEIDLIDISEDLEDLDNIEDMFLLAEEFFTSLNMFSMTSDFWNNSLFEQPDDREVVCHASAWDFYSTEEDNQEDGKFRIKMCTQMNQEDFITIHHEMGHIEYQMAYSNDMPLIYRNGANPGFHEAVGDTIALSVATQSHLKKIQGTIANISDSERVVPTNKKVTRDSDDYTDEDKKNINFLMKQALSKFVFLPYAYIIDKWRWGVFNGDIDDDEYNKKWWEMRIDYQGLKPPIDRSPDEDFDIGSKYHIGANVPYIRYFVAGILQFQFHKHLCEVASIEGEIFNCDIYENVTAGNEFLSLLSKGASEHWQDALEDFLGSRNMSADAIIEYFDPLWKFLDDKIEDKDIDVGWSDSDDVIDDFISETEEISAVVPAIVGVILAILVCIVLVAFFIGQRRRKKLEKQKGLANEAMEKEEVPPKVAEVIEMGETNRGADLHDDDDGDLKEVKKERIEDEVKSEPSKDEHETSEDKKVEEDATTSKDQKDEPKEDKKDEPKEDKKDEPKEDKKDEPKEDKKDEPKEDKKEDSQEDLSKDEAKDEQKTESPSGKDATEKETDDSHSPPA